jgi:N-acetylglucosaminyldiphosphoundecaprenol N-acetyl-beta-D-mannosaminyltransferase
LINIGRDSVNILGVKVDDVDLAHAVEIAAEMVHSDGFSFIFTPNPEIIMSAQKDVNFRNILNSATMCVADGVGVVMASKFLKTPLPERVSGFDLVCNLLDKIKESGTKIFLLGAKPGVAERAKANIEKSYPDIVVSGFNNGYFGKNDEKLILQKINNSEAQLLLTCLGSPKQERWIYKNRNNLNVNLAIGLGGVLDVFAGNVKRAPNLMIKLNLEWLYRAVSDPKRLKRIVAIPKFMYNVGKEKFKTKKISR